MQKLKIISFLLVLAAGLVSRSAFGFALGGPIGNGGDKWQTPELNYGITGDLFVAPKNIGEEYRRVTPTVYYAYDANFLGFFGVTGATNVDGAFAILNTVSNVDSYSPGLTEWPTSAKQVNNTASGLFLLDLKSTVLADMMSEQMGLAPPERFTWAMHDRYLSGGSACPTNEVYDIVQRNLGFVISSNNQVLYSYSPYVNGTLYSFRIIDDCTGANPVSFTEPYAADPSVPTSATFTAVAGGIGGEITAPKGGLEVAADSLGFGEFYTGLTRDDVAGLRYLLSSNNIYTEATTPSGAILITTNTPPAQLFGPTLPFSLLFTAAQTASPDELQAEFPGLQFASITTNSVTFIVTTNITAYFTNQSGPPVFSNTIAAHGLTNGFYLTNQPGPTVITYDTSTFVQLQTLDLGAFSDQSVTDAPAVLQALYPDLQITSVTAVPNLIYVTNFVTYLTNFTGAPFQGAPVAKTAISSITSYFGTNYLYSFANVFTNHYYTNRTVVTQNIWITNLTGAPFGSPFVAKTNLTTARLPLPSGDFFIIPTNWCGFEVLGVSPVNIQPPYATGPTNTIVFTGFNTNGPVTNPVVGGNAFGLTQNIYDIFTNYNIVLRPGVCSPALVFTTTTSSNAINTFNYVFANIVTNHFFTNTFVTIITTNISPCSGGTSTLCTNITRSTFYTNTPSGDFYILPPGLCNFSILSTQLTTIGFTTNIIFAATNGVGVTNVGQQFTETEITTFTNYTFKVLESTCSEGQAAPALRGGVEGIRFVRENYDSLIGQTITPITNYYTTVMVTNGRAMTEAYKRVVTTPDVILSASDQTAGATTTYFTRNVQFDQSTILNGLAGPGTIPPGITLTLNKSGSVFVNPYFFLTQDTLFSTNAYLGTTNFALVTWASFNGTTNTPIVYPDGQSLSDLMNQIMFTVSPTTVPDGTNGVAYSVTFTVTGGAPPYTISAPNVNALVPGLSMATVTNGTSATLSGTPIAAGPYNFNIQVQDSINRVLNLNYPITIH